MTGTILDRLRAKRPRRVVIPVDLGGVTAEDVADLAELQARQLELQAAGEPTGDVEDAIRVVEGRRVVEVVFRAAPDDAWERIVAAHPSEEGDDAGVRWRDALPLVAGVCAEDEALQDDTVWAELLTDWSYGERLTLWHTLLGLNVVAPNPTVPKG